MPLGCRVWSSLITSGILTLCSIAPLLEGDKGKSGFSWTTVGCRSPTYYPLCLKPNPFQNPTSTTATLYSNTSCRTEYLPPITTTTIVDFVFSTTTWELLIKQSYHVTGLRLRVLPHAKLAAAKICTRLPRVRVSVPALGTGTLGDVSTWFIAVYPT